MSAGSSSTMFTPAIAASSGSDPCWRRCTARSTARSPFELEIATGPPPPPAGAPFCPRAAPDSAAAAAADPNSFLLLIVMRSMKRRNLHELRGAGAAPARRGRHHLQALRAGLGVGRRRGRLLQDRLGDEVHDQRDDDEVEEAAEQVAVLDRVAARERDGRVAPLAAGQRERILLEQELLEPPDLLLHRLWTSGAWPIGVRRGSLPSSLRESGRREDACGQFRRRSKLPDRRRNSATLPRPLCCLARRARAIPPGQCSPSCPSSSRSTTRQRTSSPCSRSSSASSGGWAAPTK